MSCLFLNLSHFPIVIMRGQVVTFSTRLGAGARSGTL